MVKAAQGAGNNADLAKSFTQATGLVFYDLQPAALKLYPVITPIRNMIPRVSGNGGTATNWKAITGINTAALGGGVSERNRGGVLTTTTQNYTAAYKGLGFEDWVSYEADMAGQNFDDVKARAAEGLLRSTMIYEERTILGGNSGTVPLGTANTPSLATSTTGGAIGATVTVSVIVVALTHEGWLASRGSITGSPVRQAITRTNADGSTDTYGGGSGQKSAAASLATGAGTTNSVQATVVRKAGEVAYAWFWGAAGSEVLGAITTINSCNITTAAGAGTQTAASLTAADNSANGLIFDGIITQIFATGSGSIVSNLATGTAGTGSFLTSDGAGGIVEIDAVLKSFWDQYRLSPSKMFVNAQESQNITKKILAGTTGSLFRFNMDASNAGERGNLMGGALVGSYLNKFGPNGNGSLIQIVVHPDAIPGMIVFYSDSIPYPLSNVSNVVQMKLRRDYYQIEWPITKRSYDYGVYFDGVLQNYFPPAFGILGNIGNG